MLSATFSNIESPSKVRHLWMYLSDIFSNKAAPPPVIRNDVRKPDKLWEIIFFVIEIQKRLPMFESKRNVVTGAGLHISRHCISGKGTWYFLEIGGGGLLGCNSLKLLMKKYRVSQECPRKITSTHVLTRLPEGFRRVISE